MPKVLRALQVPVPGELELRGPGLHLVATIKPSFSFPLTLWLVDRLSRDGCEIGAAFMSGRDLMSALEILARDEPLPTFESHRIERKRLPPRVAGEITSALDGANVGRLPDVPLTGTDGLTLSVELHGPYRGGHAFAAWCPRGDHATILRILCDAAHPRFTAPWARRTVDAAYQYLEGSRRDDRR